MQEDNKKILDGTMTEKPWIKKPVLFGLLVIGIFVGGFSLWAGLAPLESAAQAPGKIIVAGYHRTIQHLEGGIVKAIYIKDGMDVKKNQVLLQLDDYQAKIVLQLRRDEVFELLGIDSRLQAEKNEANQITFSSRLLAESNNTKVQEIMKGQIAIFNANEKAFQANLTILEQQINQVTEQIKGIESTNESTLKQLKLIDEEETSVAYLEKRKLIERSRLLSLQREAARLRGLIGESQSKIAMLHQHTGEIKLKIATLKKERSKEILTELRETQQKLSAAIEKEKSADDVLTRTTIRAPQAGVVVGLRIHTIGGVIKAGEPIMDIVPNQEKLVIEAKVNPNDIDVVHKGLIAKVQLVAFKLRNTPTLLGTVTEVSADIYTDEKTGAPYYLAQIVIDKDELNRLPKKQKLYPGMPVEVMIITEKLTPWQYFIAPITQSFHKAFREQ